MSHVIAALSTGTQISAIGILRLTGDGCAQVADKVFTPNNGHLLSEMTPRKMIMGTLKDKYERVIDQCMAVYCRAPHSYTGEDTVEIHCHGSPAVLSAGLDALYAAGAEPAKRGEFTKRAFLNGKLLLTQAEAVIDLIEADTADAAANAAGQVGGVLQRKLAPVYDDLTDICSHFHAVLDYPDEDIADFGLSSYEKTIRSNIQVLQSILQTYGQGKILTKGVSVVIAGKPNVGKSSLLNLLTGYERVIVTDVAGTTRDTVEESVMLGSTRLKLIDTAGIRQTDDRIEALGVQRSKSAITNADLVLFICDGSQPLTQEDKDVIDICLTAKKVIALINKSDLAQTVNPDTLPFDTVLSFSTKTGNGLAPLTSAVNKMFASTIPCDGSILTNPRQYHAIKRAHEALTSSLQGLALGLTPDAVLTDVEEAMSAMGEVTGSTVREDITARIFERFCVGK